jgi:oligopeptide/dipeptide ABC transporter ATP-binding protein
MTLLNVENLHVHIPSRDRLNRLRVAHVLNGVDLCVAAGEIVGLVGETGAGKTLTALAIMGLLRPPAEVVAGNVLFENQDLLRLDERAFNKLRGEAMSLVVQSPRSALDPLTRIGAQLVRVHRAHVDATEARARRRALDLLSAVGIPDPEHRFRAWPHELSGGMAQRVLIAMALINEPRLLVADEPTTGLDVTVQAQILDLLRAQQRARGLGALIVTHDLGVVAHYCDRMAVMFAGAVVEAGPVNEVFASPAHPYTRALIASAPDRLDKAGGLPTAVGAPPDLYDLPEGCAYAKRCPRVDAACGSRPSNSSAGTDRVVRCWNPVR